MINKNADMQALTNTQSQGECLNNNIELINHVVNGKNNIKINQNI